MAQEYTARQIIRMCNIRHRQMGLESSHDVEHICDACKVKKECKYLVQRYGTIPWLQDKLTVVRHTSMYDDNISIFSEVINNGK